MINTVTDTVRIHKQMRLDINLTLSHLISSSV